MVTKFVLAHAAWVPLHNIWRVLSCVIHALGAARQLVFIVNGWGLLRSFKLLLAMQGIGGFLSVDGLKTSNNHCLLLQIVQRVHKEFVLQNSVNDYYLCVCEWNRYHLPSDTSFFWTDHWVYVRLSGGTPLTRPSVHLWRSLCTRDPPSKCKSPSHRRCPYRTFPCTSCHPWIQRGLTRASYCAARHPHILS